MNKKLLYKLLALLAAFTLVVAACGNDDDDEAGDAPAPAPTAAEEPAAEEPAAEEPAAEEPAAEEPAAEEPAAEEPAAEEPAAEEPAAEEPAGMDSRTWGAFTYEIDFEPSTRGVSDDTVRLGAMTQGAFYAGFDAGINARIDRANREGELPGGRSLELVKFVDDGSDPQANFEGARSMVENDEVFGIISTSAVLLPQTTNYLAENQVPFTGWGFMPGHCAPNGWGFGFNGCLSGYAFGVEGAEPNVSVKEVWNDYFGHNDYSIGYFNSDDDAGRAGATLYETVWGDQLAFNEFVPTESAGGVTDPTRFVNLVLDTNPDVVVLSTDFGGAIALKASIGASGYEGLVADYLTYVPGLPQMSPDMGQALEGGFAISQVPPIDAAKSDDEQAPAIRQLIEDFNAVEAFPGFGSMLGYWSADLMIQMIAAAGEDLNTATFYQAINIDGFESTQLEGGLGSVKFPADHVTAPDCTGMVQVVDGQFEEAQEFTCYGDPDR